MPWSSRNRHTIQEAVCVFFTITATMVDATTIFKTDGIKKVIKYCQLAFELQRSPVSVKRNKSREIKSLAVRVFFTITATMVDATTIFKTDGIKKVINIDSWLLNFRGLLFL